MATEVKKERVAKTKSYLKIKEGLNQTNYLNYFLV